VPSLFHKTLTAIKKTSMLKKKQTCLAFFKKLPLICLISLLVSLSCAPGSNGAFTNRRGETLRWRGTDFPLDVVVSSNVPDWVQDSVVGGIARWNREVNSDVFRMREEIPWNDLEFFSRRNSTVYVVMADIPDINGPNSLRAETTLRSTGEYFTDATLTFDVTLPPEDATIVALHELGHVVGLDHDTWRPSIMYRYADESGGRIMEDDANFVRWQMNNWE
jgi:hypothetical protein